MDAERDRDDLQEAMETAQEAHSAHITELKSSHTDELAVLMARIQVLEDEARTASSTKVSFSRDFSPHQKH